MLPAGSLCLSHDGIKYRITAIDVFRCSRHRIGQCLQHGFRLLIFPLMQQLLEHHLLVAHVMPDLGKFFPPGLNLMIVISCHLPGTLHLAEPKLQLLQLLLPEQGIQQHTVCNGTQYSCCQYPPGIQRHIPEYLLIDRSDHKQLADRKYAEHNNNTDIKGFFFDNFLPYDQKNQKKYGCHRQYYR